MAAQRPRRLFPRAGLTADVVLEDEHGEPLLILPAENISIGGLFLHGNLPLRVGAHLLLSIPLPNQSLPLRVVGEVVRVERVGGKPTVRGLGVRFIELSRAMRQMLEALVSVG